MTTVVDASALVDLLLGTAAATSVRDHLERDQVVSVAHLDAEVFSALARLERASSLDASQVAARLELLGALPITRLPITTSLLEVAWTLRTTIAARDALYVAAASALGARLVTTDARLRRAVNRLEA